MPVNVNLRFSSLIELCDKRGEKRKNINKIKTRGAMRAAIREGIDATPSICRLRKKKRSSEGGRRPEKRRERKEEDE